MKLNKRNRKELAKVTLLVGGAWLVAIVLLFVGLTY